MKVHWEDAFFFLWFCKWEYLGWYKLLQTRSLNCPVWRPSIPPLPHLQLKGLFVFVCVWLPFASYLDCKVFSWCSALAEYSALPVFSRTPAICVLSVGTVYSTTTTKLISVCRRCSLYFFPVLHLKKRNCVAWLINAGSFIAQKRGALCAPSVCTG